MRAPHRCLAQSHWHAGCRYTASRSTNESAVDGAGSSRSEALEVPMGLMYLCAVWAPCRRRDEPGADAALVTELRYRAIKAGWGEPSQGDPCARRAVWLS